MASAPSYREGPPDLKMHPMLTANLHDTGEHELWTAVLLTWVTDAERLRGDERYLRQYGQQGNPLTNPEENPGLVSRLARIEEDKERLRRECFTGWTATICALIDVKYPLFKQGIESMLAIQH